MAAPTSAVEVCNLALDQLKQAPVSDISSPSTNVETICARHYDQTRREVLRKHPWNFAIKRAQITKDATAPTFGWGQAYNLPSDFIRLVSIGDDSIDELRGKYEIENSQILGNDLDSQTANTIDVRYVYDITNVTKFDSLFLKTLYLQLAINLGPKFSVTSAILRELKEELAETGPRATAVDGQERTPKRIQRSRLINARKGLAGRGSVASKFTVFE
jgi:hypothetical protein